MRVAFDSTVEEYADVTFRFATQTKTFLRQRLWSQVFTGGSLAVVAVAVVISHGGISPAAIATVSAVGIGSGLLLGHFYGYFHDWYVRRNCRLLARELFNGAESVRCEFEIGPAALSCKTKTAEISLPWSRLTRINNTDRSIELWFDPGLAVVHDRAFSTVDERRNFLEAVSRFSQPKAV